jgi:uncharacterized coiled-coil protein SlyX
MVRSADAQGIVTTCSASNGIVGADPPTTGMKQLLSVHQALEGRMTGLESHIASCNLSSQEIQETLTDIHQTLGSIIPQVFDIRNRRASPDHKVMDRLEHLQFRMEDTEAAATDLNRQMAAQQVQMNRMVATTNAMATAVEGQRRAILALRTHTPGQSRELQVGTSWAASLAAG